MDRSKLVCELLHKIGKSICTAKCAVLLSFEDRASDFYHTIMIMQGLMETSLKKSLDWPSVQTMCMV